jgi:hypothetical protein
MTLINCAKEIQTFYCGKKIEGFRDKCPKVESKIGKVNKCRHLKIFQWTKASSFPGTWYVPGMGYCDSGKDMMSRHPSSRTLLARY